MNGDNTSMSSEESSSYNSEFFKEDLYGNNNIEEKFRIYKSIIKELKLKIISNPEETLSIEKEIRKQSLFSKYNVIEYKFFVIGDHFSGKTSFCLKFSKNKFNLETKPSTEIECYLKTFMLLGKEIKIYLIDLNEDLLNKNIPINKKGITFPIFSFNSSIIFNVLSKFFIFVTSYRAKTPLISL